MLSTSCRYGIRAAVYLAGQNGAGTEYVSIRKISKDLKISFHFLTKVLQRLSQDRLIVSNRGARGGVALARTPKQISLFDIVKSIDGADLFEKCVLGLPRCGERQPCPLHGWWQKERDRLRKEFEKTTLNRVSRQWSEVDSISLN